MRRLTSLAVMTFGVAGLAVAAEGTLDSARRCATVKDSLERLVCYDALFGMAAGAAAPVAPPAAVPTPVPAPTLPPAAAQGQFGGEMVKRSEERESDAGPSSLSATVQSLRETRQDVFRVTLDNGQIWQQMDKDGRFYLSVGDTVQIDRGALGGYRMARTSGGKSSWVRVSRLK